MKQYKMTGIKKVAGVAQTCICSANRIQVEWDLVKDRVSWSEPSRNGWFPVGKNVVVVFFVEPATMAEIREALMRRLAELESIHGDKFWEEA